jgi:hypothetical protein
LTAKQVEYAKTVHASGDDLLQLINEILDLSKIESGSMEIESKRLLLTDLRDYVQKHFEAVAGWKGLEFNVDIRRNAPKVIFTDAQRLQQILKNLLSNAFKFTDEGSVTLRFDTATEGWSQDMKSLDQADQVVAFSVIDTGIGIPREKHRIIFEAFQQADGTITRKYGGTGLGLSISREIATLLGGELHVASEPGEGSTFTLYLPRKGAGAAKGVYVTPPSLTKEVSLPAAEREVQLPAAPAAPPVEDDRDSIDDNDFVLLMVDTDVDALQHRLEVVRLHGFKGIVTNRADEALQLAREFRTDAISIAPNNEGWMTLDRLKRDLVTRHIPVQVIADKKERQRALNLGAFAFLEDGALDEDFARSMENIKAFLNREVKNVLVVEDDRTQRDAILEVIDGHDVDTVAVASGKEALAALRSHHFDCMVVDLGLPDMSGPDLLERMKRDLGLYDLPVIVYTAKELSAKDETRLRQLAETIIIKDARSLERLFAETALFLHRASEKLSPAKRRILEQEQREDPNLAGKKVLVIDDDVRNIFSLSSLLERHNMEVLFAENGRDGIEILKSTPDVDAVLVDIMMPDMDGYETMRQIRQLPDFKEKAIIALTAKAMKGDREKCIEAGASDYVSKPADVDRLLSLLRVYLGK